MLNRRKALIEVATSKTARIPKEYQEISYIEGNNNSYLVAPFKLNTGLRVKLSILQTQWAVTQSGSGIALFTTGTYGTNLLRLETINNGNTKKFCIYYGNVNSWDKQVNYNNINTPYSFSVLKGKFIVNGTIYTFSEASKTGDNTLKILRNAPNFRLVNDFEIETYDNNTLYTGVMCYRKSDNKIGLYDLISEQFTEGYGSLIAGGNI